MGAWDNFPTFPAGHEPTAAELKQITDWLALATSETYVTKTVDETVTSSATMQNDDELFAALTTSATYVFRLPLRYGAAATPQIKIGFTVPAGATILWTSMALDNAVTASNIGGTDYADRGGSTPTLGVNGVANFLRCHIVGRVDTTLTAGNLQFQWAQAVSNATGSIVKNGSYLLLKRVA